MKKTLQKKRFVQLQLTSSKNKKLETKREACASLFYNPNNTWVEVSTQALLHNITQYKQILPPHTILAPVIKGNAYGHGLLELAQILEKSNLVNYLCIASLSEAVFLRTQNITKSILVLSILDSPLKKAIQNNIDIVLYDSDTAKKLDALGKQYRSQTRVHIKIDTGLSRLGVHYTQAEAFIKSCLTLKNINVVGLFSHYIDAEDLNPVHCPLQQKHFNNLIKQFPTIPYKHFSCSAALSGFNTAYTFARFGIGLYGLWPSKENKQKTINNHPTFSLQPVLTWKTNIVAIKKVPAKSAIGYNATFTAPKETITAVLPIGYWDGYDRKLSNNSVVKINNQFAPVLGRVAMNMIVVDVTHIQNIKIGDIATVLGTELEISAETLARNCNTINYEITTRINPLLKRIVV